MISVIVVGAIGILFNVMGWLIWKKQKIGLLHDYHYNHVQQKDKKAFCALNGIAMLLMGTGLLVTAGILAITDAAASFLAFAAGFVPGIGLMIYAGAKYN